MYADGRFSNERRIFRERRGSWCLADGDVPNGENPGIFVLYPTNR